LALLFLLLGLPLRAATVVFDRIGEQASLAAGQPGAAAIHTHSAPLTNDFWATPAARWTQPTGGAIDTASVVFFGRDVRDLPLADGKWDYTDRALSDFSWAHLTFHLWTNGLAGFVKSPVHGDVVLDLGADMTNAVALNSTTNRDGVAFLLYRYDLKAAERAANLPTLRAGQEYLMAFVFEAPVTNQVIRVSLSSAAGAPDAYAGVNVPSPANHAGLTTELGFTRPQLAMALSLVGDAPGRLSIATTATGTTLSWAGGNHLGFEASDRPDGGWTLIEGTTNQTSLPVPVGETTTRFYRVRVQ
jgi:hypothetical protein